MSHPRNAPSIYYTGGSSSITVPEVSNKGVVTPLAASDCLSAQTCLFQHNSFGGRLFRASGHNTNYNLSAYDFNDITSSWINRR